MRSIPKLTAGTLSTLALLGWLGCGSSTTSGASSRSTTASSHSASSGATSGAGGARAASSSRSASTGGGGSSSSGATPTFVSHFDKSMSQLPEGLWTVGGEPVVSWAPLGELESVAADGGTQTAGSVGAASNTLTLGIVSDAAGALYVGVGASAVVGAASPTATPVTPAPGVYKIAAGGGAPVMFSVGSAVTPPMKFANGLAFQGSTLFVADSEGAIYRIDASGTATTWSQDPSLAPSQPACGGVVPLAVGANGIVVDATDVYVTNTNYGRLVHIPIQGDGSAGTPQVLAEDCATLAGADGLAKDTDGSFLVAVNAQNRIARVTPAGVISIVAEGAPLDTPASLYVDTSGGAKRLLVTNSSFFSAADAGAPGVLALPIP